MLPVAQLSAFLTLLELSDGRARATLRPSDDLDSPDGMHNVAGYSRSPAVIFTFSLYLAR
jgi:hypothetical protein